jgi:hypothetical protein
MPWKSIKLNDGRDLPGVGFGSSGHPKERTADDIELAIGSGFEHIDTAQSTFPVEMWDELQIWLIDTDDHSKSTATNRKLEKASKYLISLAIRSG